MRVASKNKNTPPKRGWCAPALVEDICDGIEDVADSVSGITFAAVALAPTKAGNDDGNDDQDDDRDNHGRLHAAPMLEEIFVLFIP